MKNSSLRPCGSIFTSHTFRCGLPEKSVLGKIRVKRRHATLSSLLRCPRSRGFSPAQNSVCRRDTRTLWVVAHRGASGHAPENTMAAFRRAVELGARFIETDLQLTRDARVIAIHDFTLDRTTNGHRQVHLQ